MEISRESRLQANKVLIISSLATTNDQQEEHDAELHTSALDKMMVMMMRGRMMPLGIQPGCKEGQCIFLMVDDDYQVGRPGSSATTTTANTTTAQSFSPHSELSYITSCCHHYNNLSSTIASAVSSSPGAEYHHSTHHHCYSNYDCIPNSSSSSNNINTRRSEMPTINIKTKRRNKRMMSF